MENKTIDEKIIQIKTKTLIALSVIILGFVISTTISATIIYFEFQSVKKELTTLEELHEKDDAEQTRRLNTKTDRKPMLTTDAFFEAVVDRPEAKAYWLSKLNDLSDDAITEIFSNIPSTVITDVARNFALQMVLENKKRLMNND